MVRASRCRLVGASAREVEVRKLDSRDFFTILIFLGITHLTPAEIAIDKNYGIPRMAEYQHRTLPSSPAVPSSHHPLSNPHHIRHEVSTNPPPSSNPPINRGTLPKVLIDLPSP
jgi:hypothetical protein